MKHRDVRIATQADVRALIDRTLNAEFMLENARTNHRLARAEADRLLEAMKGCGWTKTHGGKARSTCGENSLCGECFGKLRALDPGASRDEGETKR
jgi:hypothetical protein